MPASVKMDIAVDAREVDMMLKDAERRLDPTRVDVALAEVGVAIIKNNDANWGKKWQPLAQSTIDQKKGKGEPEVRTGAYKASLTKVGAEGQVHEIENGLLRLGTEIWYAHFQKGTKHQPKRIALRLTPTVQNKIKEVLHRKLLPGGDHG